MNLTEKIAYIKGLTEGLSLDEKKDEVKVLNAIIDLLDDMALTVADLEDATDELGEYVEVLDKDLGDVEQLVFDADDDCCCDDDCDCCGDDEEYYEVTCPTCGETVCVNDEVLDEGGIECPNCGENLEFDFTGKIEEDEPEK